MADESLIDKVHGLSDLELAVLLCLVSREHCLISTPPAALDDLIQELQLVFIPIVLPAAEPGTDFNRWPAGPSASSP